MSEVKCVTCCRGGWNPANWTLCCPESGRWCRHPETDKNTGVVRGKNRQEQEGQKAASSCSSPPWGTSRALSSVRQRPHPLHFLLAADPIVVTESCIGLGKTSCRRQWMRASQIRRVRGDEKEGRRLRMKVDGSWEEWGRVCRQRAPAWLQILRWDERVAPRKSPSCRLIGLLAEGKRIQLLWPSGPLEGRVSITSWCRSVTQRNPAKVRVCVRTHRRFCGSPLRSQSWVITCGFHRAGHPPPDRWEGCKGEGGDVCYAAQRWKRKQADESFGLHKKKNVLEFRSCGPSVFFLM